MEKIKIVLLALLALLAPIQAMAISAMAITLIDLVTGILAAIKLKKPITSSGLKQTVIKIFVYEIALVVGFVVQQFLIQNSIPLTNLVATLIGCTELKSVAENLETISGQPFLDAIIKIISEKQNNPQ